MGTSASSAPGIAIVREIVDVLSDAGFATDPQTRQMLVDQISNYLGHPILIADHGVGRHQLIELADRCVHTPDGLTALVESVDLIHPKSIFTGRLRDLVQGARVISVLAPKELERLRDWLTEVDVPGFMRLVRRAAGPAIPPTWLCTDIWDAFLRLADLNAGADGFPPVLSFVELVANEIGGPVAANLTEWSENQARRLRLDRQLQERRAAIEAPAPGSSRLHLLIAIEHDAIDPHSYLLSHWRQDDPADWPPPRGETVAVTHDELERRVGEVVVDAERAWATQGHSAALEMILPYTLLDLPVHSWEKEHDTDDPRPLWLDYPIVLRSLERMMSREWHRVWRQRWDTLMTDPSADRVYFGQPSDHVDVVLSDPKWVLMVLSAPPRSKELTAALRSGLPALLWHREGSSSDVLRKVIDRLVQDGGLGDLPAGVQGVRRATFAALPDEIELKVVRDLVVLWDDPSRLVALGHPQR